MTVLDGDKWQHVETERMKWRDGLMNVDPITLTADGHHDLAVV